MKIVDVYDHFLAEALFDEARVMEMPVFGHVADDATRPFDFEWTAGLGYRTLEHVDEVVRLAFPQAPSDAEVRDFVEASLRHEVSFTSLLGPMMDGARSLGRAADGAPAHSLDEEAQAFVVSGGNGRSQLRSRSERLRERTSEDLRSSMPDTSLVFRVVKELVRGGVPLVPGTEGGSLTQWAGGTLHDELALLVQAGMSPAQALRAATAEAASLLDVEGLAGEVLEGSWADAILVTSDPREDLEVMRSPHGVLVRGRWYGPEELTELRGLFGIAER